METARNKGLPQKRRRFRSAANNSGLSPGLYHFRKSDDLTKTRIHLRIDPDGCGTLVINASSILHLNPSAAMIAFYHLDGSSPDEIKIKLIRGFDQVENQVDQDIKLISADLDAFIQADGKPVNTFSGIEINAPYSQHPTAPYRMDLAVTYRCNNDCPHCYNARLRSYPELGTADWKKIIDRLWDLNIPHLIFTGGEPTLRDDLPELIRHAENLGQITGLNTNARILSDPEFVQSLVEAGLDHIQITVESHDPEIHDEMVNKKGAWKQTIAGLQNALDSSLFVMTNTTMLTNNYQSIGKTLDFLIDLGVPTIGLNALIYSGRGKDVGTGLTEEELKPLLDLAKRKTSKSGTKLIWYTPTLYCHFNPLEMGLGVKGCTAALYNMCVEPDGGVIPCQSYYHQLGNLLRDPWKSIWEHDLSLELRQRRYVPDECQTCSLLEECGAGCPLAYAAHPRIVEPIIPPPN
ncbi:MAG: radical SAM protein [Chloroflexota bacterium]|nr:MAG: radical SAM protein [Chloroflexota bacterium]